MTRAGIYLRVSSRQQQEGTSLETQEERCRAYAHQHDYTVVGTWTDIHTGAELYERRGLSDLRELVRTGQVDVILAYAVDRFSRDQNHLGVMFVEADQHGVRVETASEPIERDPLGQAVLALRSAFAAMEREKFREPPQRYVTGRLQSATSVSTRSTCHRWFSWLAPGRGSPVTGSPW